jgi:hypothetical protein
MNVTTLRSLAIFTAVGASLCAVRCGAELVAHYKFDDEVGDTAIDSATADGSQDAVQNQGDIGWTPIGEGRIGGALDLDGTSSLQAVDAVTSSATAFTISVWFNPRVDNPGYDGIYMARNENWGIAYEGSAQVDNNIDYRIDNDPGGGSLGFDSADGSITPGNWYHMALTWTTDGSFATGKAYLNGTLVNSIDSTTNPSITTTYTGHLSTWNIGDDPCCGGREINAQIDDLAVFNTALDDAGILQIYNWGLVGKDATGADAPLPPLAGDVNGDRLVNDADFQIIRNNFYNSATTRIEGDLNRDGIVDFLDFDAWKTASQGSVSAAANVPEPTALVVLLTALAAIALADVRGRRSAAIDTVRICP